jgi:SAM-dependent methyltransferase
MIEALPRASRYQGVLQIIRFNWPFYLFALAALTAAAGLKVLLPAWTDALLIAGIGLTSFWMLASMVVSHWVYDRSPLRTWRWIEPALGFAPRRWINLHAGLDESSPALRQLFPTSVGRVLDIFDAAEMTEPSILRARSFAVNAITPEAADYRHLPIPTETCGAAFLLLSAHELRRRESRARFFRELHRVLSPDGKVVLAEHLRDLPNFIAFGPGFLHFHSRRAWLAAARAGGFEVEKQFRITPFIAVLVLRRSS